LRHDADTFGYADSSAAEGSHTTGKIMSNTKSVICSFAIGTMLIGSAGQVSAVEAGADVAAFVARINALVAPVKPGDRKAVRAVCDRIVAQSFDIRAMAHDIAGEAWTRMNAEQRASYVRGLGKRASSDCASHGSEVAGNTVELVGVRSGESGDRLVAVKQSKGRGRTVVWQVRAGGDGALKAVDMTVDGRSLAAAARRDAKNVLKKADGNVLALIRSVGG
jgi:ABC-type transporter MlaC component